MSFDNIDYNGLQKINCLNPFGTGQCLSTHTGNWIAFGRKCLNPFGTGQCLSTLHTPPKRSYLPWGLNPFGTGQCLSTGVTTTSWAIPSLSQSLWNRAVSFDKSVRHSKNASLCLNPFGTGQCLSTSAEFKTCFSQRSLNPFGTGQCLSTVQTITFNLPMLSQSLWNRAVSFDRNEGNTRYSSNGVSIPLEQGSVFRQKKTNVEMLFC